MILRRRHGPHGLAVGKGQKRALGAGQALLDNHRGAGGAKRALEAGTHRVLGLGELHRHHYALAGCQAIRLDHEGRTLRADIRQGRFLIRKAPVGGRGDVGAPHELLGELLGTLHLRAGGTGAKAGDARRTHGVGNACYQRSLGTNDHQTAVGLARKVGHRRRIVLVQRDVLAHRERAAVARRDKELAAARALGQLGRQRVLAAAAAQQQDVDGVPPWDQLLPARPQARPHGPGIRFLGSMYSPPSTLPANGAE